MSQDKHRAQRREAPEPEEGARPVPKIVILWIMALVVWGVGYYAWQIGKPMLGGDSRTVAAQPAASTEAGGSTVDGGAIYNAQCSACHQATGLGIPGAFPPLAGSEWLLADPAIAVSIVHDGLQGPIDVAGSSYAGVMPNFAGNLSNEEIAAVLTHARSEWGNNATEVPVSLVNEHAERFGERGPWTAEELTEEFGAP